MEVQAKNKTRDSSWEHHEKVTSGWTVKDGKVVCGKIATHLQHLYFHQLSSSYLSQKEEGEKKERRRRKELDE